MSDIPRLLPRPLAAPGSLTDAILAGRTGALPLSVEAAGPRPRPGRLPVEAFGTTGPGLREKLEGVLAGEGYVVTTGHQPVLFLGPLYVLYKAITIIELAAVLETRLETPVVPVFWVASDDHDWDEVGGTTLLDLDNQLRRLELRPEAGLERAPVGPSPLGPEIDGLRADLAELLPDSEFIPDYLESLARSYHEGRSVSEAFASLLSATLGDRSFAWLDASAPALKTAAAGLYERMLEDPGATLDASRRGAERIGGEGFDPQVTHLEGALPLFWDPGTGRERIYYAGPADVRAGREGEPESLDTWRTRLRESPGGFSPNVESRPVLESWLLPVAATVLGPGETAYWAQLPELFERFDVPVPAVRPRTAWTVVEARIEKLLERYELDPDDLTDGGEAAAARLTGEAKPVEVEEAITALRAAIGGAMGPVDAAVAGTFPGLKTAVGRTRKALFDAVAALDHDVAHETRQRLETQIQQVERCAVHLFPGRAPQERVLNPAYYVARYGSEFIDAVAAATADAVAGAGASGGADALATAEDDG